VTFDVGSAAINPNFRVTLDSVSSNLVQYPNSIIDVYGHTDSTGSDSFNQRLSEQRAKSVSDYMTSRGVASARIRWQGFGETQPIADNATEFGIAECVSHFCARLARDQSRGANVPLIAPSQCSDQISFIGGDFGNAQCNRFDALSTSPLRVAPWPASDNHSSP